MALEREQVSVGQVGANRSQSFFQRSSEAANTRPISDTTGSDIFNALSRFSSGAHDVINTDIEKTIAEDRIKQSNIAAQDMWKAEDRRQGISEDATVGGRLAYNTIMSQHDVMNVNNDLLTKQQQNPEMTPEEIEKMQGEAYKPILDKYGVDKYSLTEASQAIQQSQGALVGQQKRIADDYSAKKHEEALSISVNDLLGDPNADVAHIIDTEIPTRAKALGITEFQYKTMLMEKAHSTANDGDPRLYQALENVDWAKGSKVLTASKQGFEQWQARELAPVIGNQMADIERLALDQTAPWNSILGKITAMNKQYPGTFSAGAVASLKLRYLKAGEQKQQTTDGMQLLLRNMTRPDAVPLAMDESVPNEMKTKYVKAWDDGLSLMAEKRIAAGEDEQQVQADILTQKIAFSRKNGLAIPSLKTTMTAVTNFNQEDALSKDGKLPKYVTNGLDALAKMPPAVRKLYVGDKDEVFADNYNHFKATMDSESAFRNASRIRDNPYKVTGQQVMELRESTDVAVDNEMSSNWMWNKLTGQQDVPEWQRNKIKAEVAGDATRRQYMGALNPTQNAETVVKTRLAQSTQTFNGTLTDVPEGAYTQHLAPRDANGKIEMQIDKATADKYLKTFTEKNIPIWQKNVNADIDESNVEFQFRPDGSTIVRASDGDIIGYYRTSDITKIGRESNRKTLKKELDDAKEEHVETQAGINRRREALGNRFEQTQQPSTRSDLYNQQR